MAFNISNIYATFSGMLYEIDTQKLAFKLRRLVFMILYPILKCSLIYASSYPSFFDELGPWNRREDHLMKKKENYRSKTFLYQLVLTE